MASGDYLASWLPGHNDFPNMTAATISRDVDYGFYLEFSDSVDHATIFTGILSPVYGGGGVTLDLQFLMESATSGSIVAAAAFQNLSDGNDLSGAVSWTEKTVTQIVPGTAETVETASITFSDGAEMDAVDALNPFRLRVRRLGTDGNDDAAGDMRLIAAILKES